jgi:hypothetical protein
MRIVSIYNFTLMHNLRDLIILVLEHVCILRVRDQIVALSLKDLVVRSNSFQKFCFPSLINADLFKSTQSMRLFRDQGANFAQTGFP